MHNHNPSLQERKIDVLFEQAQGALLTTTLASILVTYVFWDYTNPYVILAWLTSYLLFNGYRHYQIHQFNANATTIADKNHLFHQFISGVIISGAMWGGIAVYIIHFSPLHYAAIMILLAGFLVMGAAITYAVFNSAFLGYTLPLISPVTFYLLIQQDIATRTFGLLLAVCYAFSVLGAIRYKRIMSEFVNHQFANQSLLVSLQDEQASTSMLNRELEMDLIKLKQAEERLKLEKEKAEQLAETLMTLSSQDGLTGIANRRHFDDFLAKEWNRAIRSQKPLSMILCDIDHFKAYNDCYGHQEGDKCLYRIAHILEQHARRGGDLAARYGGEEFAIILPETSLESTAEIAEQIRESVYSAAIPHAASENDNVVTVSFGVATIIPRREQHSHLLVSLADKALYEAKQCGRNRIITSSPRLLDQDQSRAEGHG